MTTGAPGDRLVRRPVWVIRLVATSASLWEVRYAFERSSCRARATTSLDVASRSRNAPSLGAISDSWVGASPILSPQHLRLATAPPSCSRLPASPRTQRVGAPRRLRDPGATRSRRFRSHAAETDIRHSSGGGFGSRPSWVPYPFTSTDLTPFHSSISGDNSGPPDNRCTARSSLRACLSDIHFAGAHPHGQRIRFTTPQSRQINGRAAYTEQEPCVSSRYGHVSVWRFSALANIGRPLRRSLMRSHSRRFMTIGPQDCWHNRLHSSFGIRA